MSLFNIVNQYEEAWKAIIMPGRQEYSTYDLGPTDFQVNGMKVKRTDFRLLNQRGHIIECSFFQHSDIEEATPCVIYLHANGCCRLEALQYVDLVLANKISLFCFDFSGCGKSDGTYSTVGWFEQEDLECIIQYVLNTGKVSKVAVWGRSMGAITTILYTGKDPRITCIVLDSPFSNFKQLIKEVAKKKAMIPEFLSGGAFNMIRNTILKKANFDIDGLRPIKYVDKIKIPALFGAAKDDTFVLPQHSRDLYMAYGGPKEMMVFEGDHNSERPINWLLLVKKFLTTHLLGNGTSSTGPGKTLHPQTVSISLTDTDSNSKSTATSVSEIKDKEKDSQNQKTKQLLKSSKKVQSSQGNQQKQQEMKFTWLEHSASTPQLPTAEEVFRNEKLHNMTMAEIVNNENIPSQPKLKLAEPKGQNKAVNNSFGGYYDIPSSYTIESKNANKGNKTIFDNRRHSTLNIYPHEVAKTYRQPISSRGGSDFSSLNQTPTLLESVNTSHNSHSHNISKFIQVDQRQNKIRYDSIHASHPSSHANTSMNSSTTHAKKTDGSLKEKVGSCPTQAHSHYLAPEIPKQQTYTIEPTRLSKGFSAPGHTGNENNVYLQAPKQQEISYHSDFSGVHKYPETYREPLQELNDRRNVNNDSSLSGLSRDISTKSFTSRGDTENVLKRDVSPVGNVHRRKPVMFQVNLNSNVPFINPSQPNSLINMDFLVNSENNIVFRNDRRASDNPAQILKTLVHGGIQDKGHGMHRGGDLKVGYLGNKMASK